ncbi:MAG TPA: RsmB/NOP family class I SAM-dependent RNA methyltransferase [Patescibacteria group bacterium]|nr:RsmB/NOP family class I SAM-dependent RNA methyltransferase [Patescibacteria group bacterium]
MPGKRFFLDRYMELGHELSGDEGTRTSLRVNTLRIGREELVKRLEGLGVTLSKVDYLRDGYVVEESRFSLGASFEYLLGLFNIQEAASQFPVEVLAPAPGETVLDMCAAPGMKTTQMAAHMGNRGAIVAVDVSRKRLYALENTLERCGVENCVAYHADINELEFGGTLFDKILLDAPCSGNYVVDRAWFSKRRPRDFDRNAERQRRLMGTAWRHLREGGTLVYTTCSLEPEEDELNVQWLIDNHGAKLVKIEGPGSPGLTEVLGENLDGALGRCMRYWPDETGTQGFFVAEAVKR